jgi:hypothetical protein
VQQSRPPMKLTAGPVLQYPVDLLKI